MTLELSLTFNIITLIIIMLIIIMLIICALALPFLAIYGRETMRVAKQGRLFELERLELERVRHETGNAK